MGVARALFDPDVEAAFHTAFGLDIHSISMGKAARLMKRLPPGSVPYAGNAASWSFESHLLAAVVDQLQWVTWTLVAVNSKKQPKKPKPLPRPGAVTPPRQAWSDLADQMGGGSGG